MDNEIFVVRYPGYDQAEDRVTELMTMMGGMGQFAAPGETIVLKANLLQAAEPAKAVTTHPAVVAAVGRMTREEGAIPVIADSPGGGRRHSEKSLDRFYRTCRVSLLLAARSQLALDVVDSEPAVVAAGANASIQEWVYSQTAGDKRQMYRLRHMP